MVTLEKEIEDEPEIENEVENALQSIKKNLQRLRVGNLYGQLVKSKRISAIMKKNIRISLFFLP